MEAVAEKIIGELVEGDMIRAQGGDSEAAERVLENSFRRWVREYGQDVESVQYITLERRGGVCMYCHKPFRRVSKVRRPDGSMFDCGAIYWYEPNCACYGRCETVELPQGIKATGCKRPLIYERFRGLKQCIACRPLHKDENDGHAKVGYKGARKRVEN